MVYTLIILSILLVIAFTVVAINESQTRSAISTDESVVAFFLAESGAETMLDRIYSGTYDNVALSNLYTGCSGGEFDATLTTGEWTATFYDSDGDKLTSCSNTNWRDDVSEMKVEGNHSNTIRAISMSIRPTGSSSSTDGQCGTRDTNYAYTTTSWPSGSTYCSQGTNSSSPSFPSAGSSVNWNCNSTSGGASDSCTASRDSSGGGGGGGTMWCCYYSWGHIVNYSSTSSSICSSCSGECSVC
jgi:hypothetical protein